MTVDLDELRQRVARLEGRAGGELLPTHPALADLVQLRAGGVYGVDSASLLTALLAGPSMHGTWCGIVGSADLGLEAAAEVGIDLSRTVLVPDPGSDWLEATAALVDVMSVVAVRPPASVRAADAARLAGRLRNRGAALVVWGQWPRCDARLTLVASQWSGLGDGYGRLMARQAVIEVRRGAGMPHRAEFWWPGADLLIREVEPVQSARPVAIRSVS